MTMTDSPPTSKPSEQPKPASPVGRGGGRGGGSGPESAESKSKPTPRPDGRGRGGGGGGPESAERPSQRRSRGGAREPALLRDYIESSKRRDERNRRDERRPSVTTHRTSVEFRPQKSNHSSDTDTNASGDHGSSFVSLSSTKICYDDDRSESGLFPVKGTTSAASGVEHWKAAESAACSHTTSSSARTTRVDNRTYPYRGNGRSHRSPAASQASSGFLEIPHGGDLDDASESSSDYGVVVSDESSAGSSGSEGSSVLWDHIEKRGRHTRSGLSVSNRSGPSLDSKQRKRLKRSAMKVAHRLAKVVLAIFGLSSVLIYLAFQADFESILDDVASTKSDLMGRLFGNDLVEADKKLDNSPLLRSRALPQAYIRKEVPKSQMMKEEEADSRTEKDMDEELALARERRLRGSRQSQHVTSGPKRIPGEEVEETASSERARIHREEARTARTQERRAEASRKRMLREGAVQV